MAAAAAVVGAVRCPRLAVLVPTLWLLVQCREVLQAAPQQHRSSGRILSQFWPVLRTFKALQVMGFFGFGALQCGCLLRGGLTGLLRGTALFDARCGFCGAKKYDCFAWSSRLTLAVLYMSCCSSLVLSSASACR